jgi:hypothetical protein
MKLSPKQAREIDILRYWVPESGNFDGLTDEDIRAYFDWSDKGVAHGRNVMTGRDGFCALFWAKNRRDLQITSYLEDWGDTLNAWSFTEIPFVVRKDITKRMRKPAILETAYREMASIILRII